MNPSVFLLSRLEFRRFDIEVNPDFVPSSEETTFPQIEFDFNKIKFEVGSDLIYPDGEVQDPRHFTLAVKLSIKQSKQSEGVVLPYSLMIEGCAYLLFKGPDVGLERFKAVRGTGYLMLYGAFREHVANFTARSLHGLWFLPTPNFNLRVKEEAPKDFEMWQAAVNASLPDESRETSVLPAKTRRTKKTV